MDAIKLPIAADNPEDNNIGIVTFSKQLANQSQRGRLRIAVEPLGCLSLLDEGEQHGRPCALPSPDVRNENWIMNSKVKTQPTVHVQRPRAVLSSPENDELSCELQQQTGTIANVASDAPKAQLSLPKGLISTGVRAVYVAENSISSTDSNPDNSDFSPFSKDSLDPSNSSITIPKVTEGKPTRRHTMLEPKTISARSGNDENLLTANGKNQVVKKQVCLPSAPSSRNLKVTQKPVAKGNSGRVVRPWY